MTAYIQSWTSSLNTNLVSSSILAQGRNYLYNLKTAMSTSNLFTIEGTSNAVTGGMGLPDRISSSNDFTWAANSSAHSWFVASTVTGGLGVLPGGNRLHFLFSCSPSSSVGAFKITLTIATSPFTGGSITGSPTGSGVVKIINNLQFIRSPVTPHRVHLSYTPSGSFVFCGSRTGAGWCNSSFSLLRSLNFDFDDGYPALIVHSFNDDRTGALGQDCLSNDVSSSMLWKTGSTFHNTSSYGICYPYTTIISQAHPQYTGSNIMANFGQAGANGSGLLPDFPAVLHSEEADMVSLRGHLGDISLAPVGPNIAQGTIEPATGSSTHYINGSFWIPTNGQVPQL